MLVALAAAAQNVTVSNLQVAADNKITFNVSWGETTDSAWVFIDYFNLEKQQMWRLPVASATLTNSSWAGAKVRMIDGNNAGFQITGNANGTSAFMATVSITPDVASSGVLRPCVYVTNYPPVAKYNMAANGDITAELTGTVPFSGQYSDGSTWTVNSGSSLPITIGKGISKFVDATGCPGTVLCGNAISTIKLTSSEETQNQTVCQNGDIIGTSYTIGGMATSYTVSGLPGGVTATYNEATRTVTIGGAPTESGEFTYTVETAGEAASCKAATATGTIRATQAPAVPTLTAANACEGSGAVFTATGATEYQWTGVFNGQTGNTKTTATTAGNYTTSVRSYATANGITCYSAYTADITAYVNVVTAAAGNITGPTLVRINTSATYSVVPIVNAAGYVWTVPAGASITSGNNTNSITVKFGTTSGNVTVYGTNAHGCGNGASKSLAVNVGHAPGSTASMQNFNPMDGTTGSTWTLTDTRNNQSYKVRLMEDGRYWMVEDLKYPTACNKTSFSGAQSKGSIGSRVSGFYGDCNNIRNGSTPAARGYLYDWMFAMQDPQAFYGSGWNPGCVNNPSANAACKGICPVGWHVPTGNPSTGEFTLLNNAANGGRTNTDAGLRSNWGWVYSGYSTDTGTLNSQGSYAYYWSSSINNTYYVHILYFHSAGVHPATTHFKNYGATVRCVRNY